MATTDGIVRNALGDRLVKAMRSTIHLYNALARLPRR